MLHSPISLTYYGAETAQHYFQYLEDEAWAMLLLSKGANNTNNRFDIICARPFKTIVAYKDHCELNSAQGQKVTNASAFATLNEHWQALYRPRKPSLPLELPFYGGALGYFAYELGYQSVPGALSSVNTELPLMAVGFYDWAIVVDHREKRCIIAQFGLDQNTDLQSIQSLFSGPLPKRSAEFKLTSDWQANMSYAQYASAFERIQAYIRAGDCYQINFSQRLKASYEGSETEAFRRLVAANKAPFSALLQLPEHKILSVSPERFISVDANRQVRTEPIKGTRKRSNDPLLDKALAEELQTSEKDRAENLMIVDLLRNDLGRTCKTGSVKVPKLFELESFAAVHHLVSTITAELEKPEDLVNMFAAAFPGGSITGAPKRRAMQIIHELELSPRHIYCGSIAYFDQYGQMDSNITIRTLLCHNNEISAWGGGGVVIDSEVELEFQESLDKLRKILPILADQL